MPHSLATRFVEALDNFPVTPQEFVTAAVCFDPQVMFQLTVDEAVDVLIVLFSDGTHLRITGPSIH